jgi:hypothetical protein
LCNTRDGKAEGSGKQSQERQIPPRSQADSPFTNAGR